MRKRTYDITITDPKARGRARRQPVALWQGCTAQGRRPIQTVENGHQVLRFVTADGDPVTVFGAPKVSVKAN